MDLYQVIRHPILTEKSTLLQSQNKYVFAVDEKATKNDVERAINKLFNVEVLDVKTFNVKGQRRRLLRLRKVTKRKDWKKAIVTVKKGQKIQVFESAKSSEKEKK